jgi:hypothetical protein
MSSVAHVWGSTAAERSLPMPCDGHLPDADAAYWRAVDVEAPASVVFRWLCQLRAAPYSYDWIDNWGRRSPQSLTPGLDRLAAGQTVMTIFELVEFERDRQLTLVLRRLRGTFGQIAVTYLADPRGDERCRLLVKLLIRFPAGPVRGRLVRYALPWGDLVMMRRQLLNLKRLAEKQVRIGA